MLRRFPVLLAVIAAVVLLIASAADAYPVSPPAFQPAPPEPTTPPCFVCWLS